MSDGTAANIPRHVVLNPPDAAARRPYRPGIISRSTPLKYSVSGSVGSTG